MWGWTLQELERKDLEELEEAKEEFNTAIENLSKLAHKGFKFEIKVGPEENSDVLLTLADHEPDQKVKGS